MADFEAVCDVLDLAKQGKWDDVRTALIAAPHLVNIRPHDRNFAIVHFAAHQLNYTWLEYIVMHLGADLTLRTGNGQTVEEVITAACSVLPSKTAEEMEEDKRYLQWVRKALGTAEAAAGGERLSLICPVCLEIYNDPMQMGCGHTLCSRCASQYPTCPECHQSIDQSSLKPNATVREAVEELCTRAHSVVHSQIMFGNRIHSSVHAFVHEAEYHGEKVAVKEFFVTGAMSHHQEAELAVPALLGGHPHIVPFMGSCKSVEGHLLVVTKFMAGGSLYSMLHEGRGAPGLQDGIQLMIGVAEGLIHLHSHGVLHRDLKTRNILLDERMSTRLTSFGQSRACNDSTMTGQVGTPAYSAPEVLQNTRYNEKADVYSFGITAWEVFSGRIPFSECAGPMQVMLQAVQGDRPPLDPSWPAPISDLVMACWAPEAVQRPTMQQVLAQMRAILSLPDLGAGAALGAAWRESGGEAAAGVQDDDLDDIEARLIALEGELGS